MRNRALLTGLEVAYREGMSVLQWNAIKRGHRVALMMVVGLGFLFLGFQNCAPVAEVEDDGGSELSTLQLKEEIERRNLQLQVLSEANRSCVADSDCIAIPVGHKVCGGPRTYTFSSIKNDVPLLNRYSTELKELERKALDPNLASDCALQTPPVLTCVASLGQATQ